MFENFPYTNFHELNLDWLLKQQKEIKNLAENINSKIVETVRENIEKYMFKAVYEEDTKTIYFNLEG